MRKIFFLIHDLVKKFWKLRRKNEFASHDLLLKDMDETIQVMIFMRGVLVQKFKDVGILD